MTAKLVLHARIKNVELDYHFVRDKVAQEELITQFVRPRDQFTLRHWQRTDSCSSENLIVVNSPLIISLRGSVKDRDKNPRCRVHVELQLYL